MWTGWVYTLYTYIYNTKSIIIIDLKYTSLFHLTKLLMIMFLFMIDKKYIISFCCCRNTHLHFLDNLYHVFISEDVFNTDFLRLMLHWRTPDQRTEKKKIFFSFFFLLRTIESAYKRTWQKPKPLKE